MLYRAGQCTGPPPGGLRCTGVGVVGVWVRAARGAGPLAVSSDTALVATEKLTLDSDSMPNPKTSYDA